MYFINAAAGRRRSKPNRAPMKKTVEWIAILLFSGNNDFASLPAFESRQRSSITAQFHSLETHQINDVHISRRTMCSGRRPSAVAFQYLYAIFQFADKQREILLTGRAFMWKFRNINLIFLSHSLSFSRLRCDRKLGHWNVVNRTECLNAKRWKSHSSTCRRMNGDAKNRIRLNDV